MLQLKNTFNIQIDDEALQASSEQFQPSVPFLKISKNSWGLLWLNSPYLLSSFFSADQPELWVEFAATEQLELQLKPATPERSELQLESSTTTQLHLESATCKQPPVQITQTPIKCIAK